MDHCICDMCGKDLLGEDIRYVMKMEIYCAYDPMEITYKDLAKDHKKEIQALIKEINKIDPEELQNQVYYMREFDLCKECHKKMLMDPLGKNRRGINKKEII